MNQIELIKTILDKGNQYITSAYNHPGAIGLRYKIADRDISIKLDYEFGINFWINGYNIKLNNMGKVDKAIIEEMIEHTLSLYVTTSQDKIMRLLTDSDIFD